MAVAGPNRLNVRAWLCVDKSGNSQVIEMDKLTVLSRCNLPACDMRLLDPFLDYPPTILAREKAIVVRLEHIHCIITTNEVLILNSRDPIVIPFVDKLQRLTTVGLNESNDANQRSLVDVPGNISPDYLPFEFKVLELALEDACTGLNGEVAILEGQAYPLLDELTSKMSIVKLEHMRYLKGRQLLDLTRRTEKLRDMIERLMTGDGDVGEMFLTEMKRRMESSIHDDQSCMVHKPADGFRSISSVSSPSNSQKLKKSLSIKSAEPEMMLERYFFAVERTLNKLKTLKEYIDDSEDYIRLRQDHVRNQLIQYELVVTTASFVASIFGIVAGIFGMNVPISLYKDGSAFKWILIITGVSGVIIFCAFVWFFRYRRVMRFLWG